MLKLCALQNDDSKIVFIENFDIEVFSTHNILFDVDCSATCLTYDDSMEYTLIGEVIIFGDYHRNYLFGKFCFEVI